MALEPKLPFFNICFLLGSTQLNALIQKVINIISRCSATSQVTSNMLFSGLFLLGHFSCIENSRLHGVYAITIAPIVMVQYFYQSTA